MRSWNYKFYQKFKIWISGKFSSSLLISKDIHKYIFTSFFLIFLYQIIKPTLTSCDQTLRGSQTLWLIIDLTLNPGLPLVKNKNTERSLDDATVTYHGSLTGSSHYMVKEQDLTSILRFHTDTQSKQYMQNACKLQMTFGSPL